MSLNKLVDLYQGRMGQVHRAARIQADFGSDKVTVFVRSYTSLEVMLSPNPQMVWEQPVEVPRSFIENLGGQDLYQALEQWLVDNTEKYGGATIEDENSDEVTLEVARKSALGKLCSDYTAATAGLTEGYPETEQKSWPFQVAEAKAFLANTSAATPWIDATTAINGRDKTEFAQAILGMNDGYRTLHGHATGVLQLARTQIGEAADAAAVQAVTWDFAAPAQGEAPAPAPAPAPSEPEPTEANIPLPDAE